MKYYITNGFLFRSEESNENGSLIKGEIFTSNEWKNIYDIKFNIPVAVTFNESPSVLPTVIKISNESFMVADDSEYFLGDQRLPRKTGEWCHNSPNPNELFINGNAYPVNGDAISVKGKRLTAYAKNSWPLNHNVTITSWYCANKLLTTVYRMEHNLRILSIEEESELRAQLLKRYGTHTKIKGEIVGCLPIRIHKNYPLFPKAVVEEFLEEEIVADDLPF